MKLRSDIVRTYRDVHSWAGILCGLFLFTAFYAGAVTMFAAPLTRALSPTVAATPLEQTPRLIAETLRRHPEAGRAFSIHLADAGKTGRMSWLVGGGPHAEHGGASGRVFAASLDAGGHAAVAEKTTPTAVTFVDLLHQQAGLPLGHQSAMVAVGIVCLIYVLALISGLIVLLPSLIRDLFALRLGSNLKRMWLDVHAVLGVFSLPFHLVMGITALAFAFHGLFYASQDLALYGGKLHTLWPHPVVSTHAPSTPLLAPGELAARLKTQAPGFVPERLDYRRLPGGRMQLNVWGRDPRYVLRGPDQGYAGVDPYDGKILQTDYLPGRQSGWYAAVTTFFSLHFGNFGGLPVRWCYFLLGLSGAFLFYTGNRLWIVSRRRLYGGETRSTRILAALTHGWTLGTVAGISLVLMAAKAGLGAVIPDAALFYAVLAAAICWAFWRGEARSVRELGGFALLSGLLVPVCLFV